MNNQIIITGITHSLLTELMENDLPMVRCSRMDNTDSTIKYGITLLTDKEVNVFVKNGDIVLQVERKGQDNYEKFLKSRKDFEDILIH